MIGTSQLRIVKNETKPKPRKCKPREPKRESAVDIAARIRKGRKPAKQRIFQETVKSAGDLIISNIGC